MPTSEVIKLKGVRLSFPHLFKAKSFREGQEPRFESSFLLDPSNKAHAVSIAEIKAIAAALVKAEWGSKPPKKLGLCYGMADDDEKEYDGYEGMFYISSANKMRPTVVDQKLAPLTVEDGKPYAGCYVNASITLWTQDNEFGERVNANLRAVQFIKDGEAFGVKPVDAEEEFDVVEDEGEEFLD